MINSKTIHKNYNLNYNSSDILNVFFFHSIIDPLFQLFFSFFFYEREAPSTESCHAQTFPLISQSTRITGTRGHIQVDPRSEPGPPMWLPCGLHVDPVSHSSALLPRLLPLGTDSYFTFWVSVYNLLNIISPLYLVLV